MMKIRFDDEDIERNNKVKLRKVKSGAQKSPSEVKYSPLSDDFISET